MVDRIRSIASEATHILPDHIYVMSSHTHSGGGAFMEMLPLLANVLAGSSMRRFARFYEQRTAEAIIAANKTLKPARSRSARGEARESRVSGRRGRPTVQSILKSRVSCRLRCDREADGGVDELCGASDCAWERTT